MNCVFAIIFLVVYSIKTEGVVTIISLLFLLIHFLRFDFCGTGERW